MSFDLSPQPSRKIAVIGGGISGMATAYLLSRSHRVTLFEAEPRFGGHARTVTAGIRGDQPVDTGFIVFNYANYPHLTRLFQDLDVPVQRSDMSFGISVDNGRVEYALRSLDALLGQRSNMFKPSFYRMINDIFRFNAQAEDMAKNDDITIGELVDALNLGRWFQDYYLMPFCGAIWSSPAQEIRNFPAESLVRFFRNHALMNVRGQHQWWTVKGGSREYVSRLIHHLSLNGVTLRSNTPVQAVQRNGVDANIKVAGQELERFDQVVFACHPDQALKMLARPTADEQSTLSDIGFQDNTMVLHRDTTQMPNRRACWSSWVYKADSSDTHRAIGVTYWMNRLQNIPDSDPLFVSLNPASPVNEALIYDQTVFRHPVFDRAALKAQKRIATMQGQNNTWFTGAWLRNGFHEDGFASAVRVARQLEAELV
ncbi:NAD(P)/FAD-dependent oxidoreductase [Falsiruegeria mediterranea]